MNTANQDYLMNSHLILGIHFVEFIDTANAIVREH